VALTPVPWVDGLGAFGLSADSGVFDYEEQPDHVDVYTDMDLAGKPAFLKDKGDGDTKDKAAQGQKKVCPKCKFKNQADATKCKRCNTALVGNKAQDLKASADPAATTGLMLGMRIDVRGNSWEDVNIDTGKLDAALTILGNGDQIELPFGLSIQRLDSDGESLWLMSTGWYSESRRAPTIIKDATKVSATAQAELQRCKERQDAERAQYATDAPKMAKYSAVSKQEQARLRLAAQQPPPADQDNIDYEALARSLEDSDGDPLSEGGEPGTIQASVSTDKGTHTTMTLTVEELLAQQQAEIERLTGAIADRDAQLQASAVTTSALDQTVRAGEIKQKIKKHQDDGVDPAFLLAAQAVYIADDTPRGTDGDLNLSVTTPRKKDDGTVEQVEQTLTTPTQIVDYLLAAVPRVTANEAARMAALTSGIPQLTLTAHEPKDEVAEKERVAREAAAARHPDLYNADGTPKNPAQAA
jgi:ribosomal protein L40E